MAAVADEKIEQALREAVARAEPELDDLAADVADLLHREMDEFADDEQSREDTAPRLTRVVPRARPRSGRVATSCG